EVIRCLVYQQWITFLITRSTGKNIRAGRHVRSSLLRQSRTVSMQSQKTVTCCSFILTQETANGSSGTLLPRLVGWQGRLCLLRQSRRVSLQSQKTGGCCNFIGTDKEPANGSS